MSLNEEEIAKNTAEEEEDRAQAVKSKLKAGRESKKYRRGGRK